METRIRTLGELKTEVDRFAATLIPRTAGAVLVTLSGELGAGKTAFTQALAKTLGVDETVTSPTFVLEKIYALPSKALFDRLIHIDAYRLEGGDDLAALGFDEFMHSEKNLIVLEWPEKVASALPTPAAQLSITVHPDNSRTITYD